MYLNAIFRHPAARVISRVALGVAAFVLVAGTHFGILHATGNFHTVVPGVFYRSAQPTGMDIARYASDHGIRTIVNLRGENSGSPWYEVELAVAERLGITHVDFRMSSRKELTRPEAAELIDIFARAQKPILVHCMAGADRSSLASALYVAAVAKGGEAAAERQFSVRYGHVSLPMNRAYAMDRTFESLEPWLGYPDS